ncbi:RNA polymerase sigma factor SigI [Actinocrispum wychmicini]|uniref:RNA polymerase sigma factor SigI n=1 Tax=Actinocrispum wychmicini TaxID=1213861 RepID=UPI001A9E6797|nr:RNA polymerase sigma factor SigI [Actinocrispum wychmicini]
MNELSDERFAEVWRTSRAYLVDIAFRMLGDVGAAEDVVQEAFARLARTEPGEIDDERGWLTVVTGRLCLDQIRSARARREQTHDSAVLEAMSAAAPDPADRITLDDSVRTALFVVLERLSPAERVTFVLHDVFQLPFEAIAQTLGRPVTTCRQLARRARQKIADAPGRMHEVAPAEHRLVTEKFITACANGDFDGLLAVLHPDAWGQADFVAGSALAPVVNRGRERVIRGLMHFYSGLTLVSDPPTVLCYADRTLFATLTLTIADGVITKLHAVVDPTAWWSVQEGQTTGGETP